MVGRLETLAEFEIAARMDAGPRMAMRLVFGLLCFGAYLLARLLIDQVAANVGAFALIYPTLLLATLFGGWLAGAVTYVAALSWAWFVILPAANMLRLVKRDDAPPTVVNAVSLLIILIFAEAFRRAVRGATQQRDVLVDSLRDREGELEREVERRTRELGETWRLSPDLLGVLNADGYFEQTNPAWQDTLGWPETEIRTTRFFAFVHPDDLAATHSAWEDIQNGNPVLRLQNRYRRSDGDWRWLSWVVVREGRLFYCSARDVTEEVVKAQTLEQVEEALRQSQKMEAIGQLTGGVAHDFNNLLTVIGGSAHLLRRPDLLAERRERYIDAITSTVARASRLTAQLLAFARRQALKPEVFDIGENVRGVIDIVKSLTGSRVVVEIDLPETHCFALADPTQFDTALINLAVNARDAMSGEGRLSIAVNTVGRIPAVRAHPAVTGSYVAVCVTDGGCGIGADRLERIFEPFFTTKGVGEGTGLGLSQVFGFAKQSNGEVRVESEEGAGSTFTLYLPSAEAGIAGEKVDDARDRMLDGGGMCVLVVEDNPEVLEFAAQALTQLGYGAIHACNANAALGELAKDADRFDVVFTDVVMPGMSGIELGQEIRKHYPGLPVVLTSGYSDVLAQNGTYGFELLHKPYSLEQLSAVLDKAARRRGAKAG